MKTTYKKQRNAAALIEMALILPVLVVLVLICVDFGRFATAYTAVTNAAREGASFGGTHPHTDSTANIWRKKITETVSDEMSGIPGFATESLVVSEPVLIASQKRSRVRVKVTYNFKPAITWPILPKEMKITRTAEMPVVR